MFAIGRGCMRGWIALAGIAAGAMCSLVLPSAADSQLTGKGMELAQQHCGRCHIVSDKNRFGGISSTPSFKIMIEVLKDWEDRFATFMARNPHPAHIRLKTDEPRPAHLPATVREVLLDLDEIEAILAYVDQMAVDLGKK